jgi:hypothetical protein
MRWIAAVDVLSGTDTRIYTSNDAGVWQVLSDSNFKFVLTMCNRKKLPPINNSIICNNSSVHQPSTYSVVRFVGPTVVNTIPSHYVDYRVSHFNPTPTFSQPDSSFVQLISINSVFGNSLSFFNIINPGFYKFTAKVNFSHNSTGIRQCQLKMSQNTIISQTETISAITNTTQTTTVDVSLTTLVKSLDNSYFWLDYYQNSGVDLTISDISLIIERFS